VYSVHLASYIYTIFIDEGPNLTEWWPCARAEVFDEDDLDLDESVCTEITLLILEMSSAHKWTQAAVDECFTTSHITYCRGMVYVSVELWTPQPWPKMGHPMCPKASGMRSPNWRVSSNPSKRYTCVNLDALDGRRMIRKQPAPRAMLPGTLPIFP
jgi:hypothetical protein